MSSHPVGLTRYRIAIRQQVSEAELRRAVYSALRATIALWIRRAVTRRQLRALDGRQLSDIGRSEYDRRRECAKWFWE